MQRQEISFENIPLNVWLEILSYLKLDELAAIMCASKLLYKIANDKVVWQNLSKFHFPDDTKSIDSREEFQKTAKSYFPVGTKLFLLVNENNVEQLKKIGWDNLLIKSNTNDLLFDRIIKKNNQPLLERIFKLYLVKSPSPKANFLHWIVMCNAPTKWIEFASERKLNMNTIFRGETPLSMAAKYGRSELALSLITAGAGVNLWNAETLTPLYRAAEFGHLEVVKILLANKADPNVLALDIACGKNHIEIVKLLLTEDNINCTEHPAPLNIAVTQGHSELVQMLLDMGADPNKFYGFASPLYNAAQIGHNNIVKLLLENKGTDINLGWTKTGDTPLFVACQNGHSKVVETLCSYGADINQSPKKKIKQQTDHDENMDSDEDEDEDDDNDIDATPLFMAAQNGYLEIVKILLKQKNIDIDAARHDGQTPLSIAREGGHKEIVKALRAHKKDSFYFSIKKRKATLDSADPTLFKKRKEEIAASEALKKTIDALEDLKQYKEVIKNDDELKSIYYSLIKRPK